MTTDRVARAVDAVTRITATADTADELLEGLSDTLHRLVPHDAGTWLGVDPVTMPATATNRCGFPTTCRSGVRGPPRPPVTS